MAKLTNQQEKYCQARLDGNGISESYLIAYPNSLNYTKNTLYNVSSTLEHTPKIIQRISQLQKPLNNYLEQNRLLIIQKAIDTALGNDVMGKTNVSVLNKLLDKLLPNKIESKIEANQKFNISIEELLDQI